MVTESSAQRTGTSFVSSFAHIAMPAGQRLSLPELPVSTLTGKIATSVLTGHPYKVEFVEKLQSLPSAKNAIMGGVDALIKSKAWKASEPGWKLTVTPLPTPVIPGIVLVHQEQRAWRMRHIGEIWL